MNDAIKKDILDRLDIQGELEWDRVTGRTVVAPERSFFRTLVSFWIKPIRAYIDMFYDQNDTFMKAEYVLAEDCISYTIVGELKPLGKVIWREYGKTNIG